MGWLTGIGRRFLRTGWKWLLVIALCAAVIIALPLVRSASATLHNLGVALVGVVVLSVIALDWRKVEWRPRPQLGSVREWLVAVAAVIAAAGTVAAAWYAQVQINDARHDRQLDQAAQRAAQARAQADQVSAWPYATDASGFPETQLPNGKLVTYIELINTSGQPVYQAVVILVFVQGAGPRTGREESQMFLNKFNPLQQTLAVIPPGRSWISVEGGWLGMMKRPGAELAFTDDAGRTWVRSASGALTQIHEAAASYYHVLLPASWVTPQTTAPRG